MDRLCSWTGSCQIMDRLSPNIGQALLSQIIDRLCFAGDHAEPEQGDRGQLLPGGGGAPLELPPPPHRPRRPGMSQHYNTISQHYITISQHSDAISQHYITISQHCNTVSQHYNTISRHFYPVEEARRSNFRHRPIGLGVQVNLYMYST